MPLNLKATQVIAADRRPRQIIPGLVFSTGVDAYGDVLPAGSVDPHWLLVYSDTPGYPGPDAIVMGTIWPIWPPHATPKAKWIHYKVDTPTNAGRWEFEQSFTLPAGADPDRTILKGRLWMFTTDGLCEFALNSNVVAYGHGEQDVVIEGGFVTGVNTLRAVIRSLPWLGPSPSQFQFRVDELSVAPETAAPASIDLIVDNTVSGQQYRFSSPWVAPAATNLIDRYEVETRRFADAGGTTPLDPAWLPWRTASASETIAYSNAEDKPVAAAEYLQVRLSVVDRNDVRSAWIYSPIRTIDQAAPGGIAPSQIDTGAAGQILAMDPGGTAWAPTDLEAGLNTSITHALVAGVPRFTVNAKSYMVFSWAIDPELDTTLDQVSPVVVVAPSGCKLALRKSLAGLKAAPTGAAAILDIRRSTDQGAAWTSIYGATKLVVADGAKAGTQDTFISPEIFLASGDWLSLAVVQKGSGAAGGNGAGVSLLTEIVEV